MPPTLDTRVKGVEVASLTVSGGRRGIAIERNTNAIVTGVALGPFGVLKSLPYQLAKLSEPEAHDPGATAGGTSPALTEEQVFMLLDKETLSAINLIMRS